jgi:hypothetical protein
LDWFFKKTKANSPPFSRIAPNEARLQEKLFIFVSAQQSLPLSTATPAECRLLPEIAVPELPQTALSNNIRNP